MWLDQGEVAAEGPVRDVLASYRQAIDTGASSALPIEGLVRLLKADVAGPDGGTPTTQEPLSIELVVESPELSSVYVYLGCSQGTPTPIFLCRRGLTLAPGEQKIRLDIDRLPLPRGRYYVWTAITKTPLPGVDLISWMPVTHFDVNGPDLDRAPRGIVRPSPVHVQIRWELS